jgi:hypothetical protein
MGETAQAWAHETYGRDLNGALRTATGLRLDANGISRRFYGKDFHEGFGPWTDAIGALSTPTRAVRFRAATDLTGLTEVPVTNAANAVTTTAVGSALRLTSTAATDDDRRLYLLDAGYTPADVEVRLCYSTSSGGAQVGVAARASTSMAAIGWQNVVFGANASELAGFWQYDGNLGATFATNQMANSLNFRQGTITASSGSGTAVTATTAAPHLLRVGQAVRVTVTGLADTAETVATVPNPYTFTFPDAAAGNLGAGTWRAGSVAVPVTIHRWIAMRVVGTTHTIKQWEVGEAEPAWNDATRTATNTIPATLSIGAAVPNATGRVGVLVAHFFNTGRQTTLRSFEARTL